VEYIKTFFLFSNFFRSFENRAVGGIVQKNVGEPDRPQLTIWRIRIACWIPKATNTYSGYVILIAFTLQEWLHECTTVLRYTYIACHVQCSRCFKTLRFWCLLDRASL